MTTDVAASTAGKTAYLFPGQGSQVVGMGLELYQGSPVAREVFEQVDAALDTKLSHLMFFGPESGLLQTVNAQPAIFAASLAAWRAAQAELGPDALPPPDLVAGHSLGEYTALVVAGALDLETAARLVRERGRLMQEAGQQSQGGMAAVLGLDEVTLEEVCLETGVQIANVNSDDQIVLSGDRTSLARAMDLAAARGAKKVVPLHVSGAFHSNLMRPAQEGLARALEQVELRDPRVPVVANATAQPLTTARELKEELLVQLCSPVQWKRSVQYMAQQGVDRFLELGPGRVLSGLVKRIAPGVQTIALGDLQSIRKLVG